MKNLLILAAFAFLTLGVTRAENIFTPFVPATIKLDAVTNDMPFQEVGTKISHSKTVTNTTEMFKGTVAHTSFGNAEFLALIANSFHTNFPSGSQVGITLDGIVVMDFTGTNVLFAPGGVIFFQIDQELTPATETFITTESASGVQFSGNVNETVIGSVSLIYDDTLLSTTDGTHTKFTFKGLFTTKATENAKTRAVKATYQFDGTGGGPVRSVPTILTGSISGKGAGVAPPGL